MTTTTRTTINNEMDYTMAGQNFGSNSSIKDTFMNFMTGIVTVLFARNGGKDLFSARLPISVSVLI